MSPVWLANLDLEGWKALREAKVLVVQLVIKVHKVQRVQSVQPDRLDVTVRKELQDCRVHSVCVGRLDHQEHRVHAEHPVNLAQLV